MTIGDLLASITGDEPSPSPTSATRPAVAAPKRKAADELRPAPVSKVARTGSPSTPSSRPSGESSRPSPRPAERPAGNPIARPTPTSQSSKLSTSVPRRPTSTSTQNGTKPSPAARTLSSGKPLPSRPLDSRPVNTDSGPKPGQKKGSFAEILARARANTELRASFGKIQHKPIEKKPLTMKERKQLKADEARQTKLGSKQQSSGKYAGTAGPSRTGATRPGQRPSLPSKAAGSKDKSPIPEVKKVKKAALATTGYAGTARPRPGATAPKPGAASRVNCETGRETSRYGGAFSRPRRREEEDELDDFIDYDEEEEPRYGYGRDEYDSAEDDSDMEAGLSDIDEEEKRAERQARLEDQREQEELERRKQEKERRKRLLAKPAR